MRRAMLAAALVLAGCTAVPPPGPRGDALHRALHGLWCNSNDGGRSCWAWDEFSADGRFRACGRTDDDPRPFRGEGRVEVSGRRMCYTVDAASENFWLRPGQRYCTDIVAIDAQTHRYRDIDTGAEFTLFRRDNRAVPCP
ncbi:MAG: hypothetical protein AB7U92_13795 [Piscinibacter sp.]|uniref:hypothetical protein n=1 Tax=Piscinibacter sp. TaxID=1903157 RepID=UPI003D122B43